MKKSLGYRELSMLVLASFVCVGVTTKYGNIVLEQRLREIFGLKTEGVAGG